MKTTNKTVTGKLNWKTRMPFYVSGRWVWLTWLNNTGNVHAAAYAKAEEIGATQWNYNQADHGEAVRVNYKPHPLRSAPHPLGRASEVVTMTTIDDVTDGQIRQLQHEAQDAGDLAQVVICRTACGDYDTTQTKIQAARKECVRVIQAAEAQS